MLLALLSPWALREPVRRWRPGFCLLAGLGAACVQFGLFVGAISGGIDEPFAGLGDYVSDASMMALLGTLAVVPLAAICSIGVLLRSRTRPLNRVTSAIFLSPLPLTIPMAVWALFDFLGASHAYEFYVAGKPAWFDWPVFAIADSNWWLLGAGIWIALGARVGLRAANDI